MIRSNYLSLSRGILAFLWLLSLRLYPASFPVLVAGYGFNEEGIYAKDALHPEQDNSSGSQGVSQADGAGSGKYDICLTTETSDFLPPPYGNLSNTMPCMPLWNTFVLRYLQEQDNVMTMIVSAVYTTGWVGFGFSKDGRMVGSSAMVGWITKKGHPKIKQYYLQGKERYQVVPDQGELELTNVPPAVVQKGAMIYMAFQVKFPAKVRRQSIVLAFSSSYPSTTKHLKVHQDKSTVTVDFSKGYVSDADSATSKGRRAHGTLAIMGWGVFLPLGAIVARHMKHRDPLWYYLHVTIQFIGFILGLAAALLGMELYDKIRANIPLHKGIGILLLALSSVQVAAFFLRPKKEAKIRKYWNWFHHWMGRTSLFVGAMNILLGVLLAHAGNDWRVGYAILVTVTVLAVIILEGLRLRNSMRDLSFPGFQTNTAV